MRGRRRALDDAPHLITILCDVLIRYFFVFLSSGGAAFEEPPSGESLRNARADQPRVRRLDFVWSLFGEVKRAPLNHARPAGPYM